MISEKEIKLITYWELEREQRAKFSNKLLSGIPMAFLFGLPILLSITVVYLFFPEWYTKISNLPKGILPTIFLAVILSMLFFPVIKILFIDNIICSVKII